MSEQNIKTFEAALKEFYLPAWQNQLGTEPAAILNKIKKPRIYSNEIVATAPVGLSGGFGFSEEGEQTPNAGHVRFSRFKTTARDMYVNIEISAKATKLTGSKGAMVEALAAEMDGAYETAKWNVGRALFGNGTGVLASVSALEVAGNTATVDSVKNLKEGLIVDFYATGSTTAAVSGRRITAIDRANKTITFDGTATTLSAGFVTVQKSYGREITGLGAIFDSNVTTLYGLTKSSNPYLNPITYDADGDISDGVITKVLRMADRDKNGQVDTLMCGDDAYDAYVDYLRTNNIRVEEMSHVISGGFKAIKFLFGRREVDIINESFVPDEEIWGVNSKDLELHNTDWSFAELQGGGIFNLMENTSSYRALLVNYGDLICKNPGGCVRIYDCV